ncbi:MAG: amidase [Deltaproteobacteria bacterium]|nr:amidase [Deltaproteobacteria bacterium]
MSAEVRWPTVPEAAARVRARDPMIRAFVRTRLEEALAEHAARRSEPPGSVLHGVPYSLKDMWDTAGIPTSGGSYRYRDRLPTASSPVHEVFADAGAVLLGKTNLSDMGLAPESASWVGGVTANPADLGRTAGGSSGGAAAAVADGMSTFEWGSDFGGSIRIPAAFCGVFGMRLSTETWPVRGSFPNPPPSVFYMNGQGPLARDVFTMRSVLGVAAPRLRTGAARSFALRGAVLWAPRGKLCGQWPSFADDVGPAAAAAFGEVRRDEGLPTVGRAFRLALAMYAAHFEDFVESDTLGLAEGLVAVLSALALRGRLGDKRLHPHTAKVLLLCALGRVLFWRDRHAAERDVAHFRADVGALWDRGFVVVAPTTCYPAPPHGKATGHPILPACCMPGNIADATALAVPFGRFPGGLPRSVQIWGPPGSEDVLLDLGAALASRGPGPR